MRTGSPDKESFNYKESGQIATCLRLKIFSLTLPILTLGAVKSTGVNMDSFTISNALQSLKSEEEPYKELLRHGSLTIEIYKPECIDHQESHSQDEVYVVASGSGIFVNGVSREKFEPGELLFVPAGVVHRFEDFTEDFSTWVIFYGPEGGEAHA
ncbi:MAG: mannose-6-phosphate isomerase-like protein (cupin superfamily) [Halioglobus sp.]